MRQLNNLPKWFKTMGKKKALSLKILNIKTTYFSTYTKPDPCMVTEAPPDVPQYFGSTLVM